MEDMASKCPNCGSTKLEFPQNIKIADGIFIKEAGVQLRGKISSEAIIFVCEKCKREIKARELI